MKNLVLVLLLLVSFVLPSIASGGNLVGSLPDRANASKVPARGSKSIKLTKGDSHTNGDGVTVDVHADSKGGATMTPKVGDVDSETTVNTKSKFKGDISGIDGNDTVNFGSSAQATVSGTGGAVSVGSGMVTVTNTGPVGGANIHVTDGQGTVHDLAPGETKIFGE